MSRYDTPEGKVPACIIILGIAAFAAFLFTIFPIAADRELARRQIAQEVNCRNYGSAMNQWAAEHDYAPVCPDIKP